MKNEYTLKASGGVVSEAKMQKCSSPEPEKALDEIIRTFASENDYYSSLSERLELITDRLFPAVEGDLMDGTAHKEPNSPIEIIRLELYRFSSINQKVEHLINRLSQV